MNSDLLERFNKKVEVIQGGCWNWIGARTGKSTKTPGGYGVIGHLGKTLYAHRLSFEHWKEPLHKYDQICHTCDNPSCVNPDHLFAASQKDNLEDAGRKGRLRTPRKYPNSLVRKLRAEYAKGNVTQKELAERYGMSRRYVGSLINGNKRSDVLLEGED